MSDDKRFLEKVHSFEKMRDLNNFPEISKEKWDENIADLYQRREKNRAKEVKMERLKEKMRNLELKSAKLKEFIDEEFKKLHKERDRGLFDLIEKMRKE